MDLHLFSNVLTQTYVALRFHYVNSFLWIFDRHVRPVMIQISLRVHAAWSEYSLGAFWIGKDT